VNDYQAIKVSHENGVAHLQLNRPERAVAVWLIDQRRPARGKAAIAGYR